MSDFIKIDIPQVKIIGDDDIFNLKRKIAYLEDKFPKSKVFIDSLCKTEKTFDNSLTAIFDYLEFTDYFNGLELKEKRNVKYLTSLKYDFNTDSLITFQTYTKEYKTDLMNMKHIIYSSYNVADLFYSGKQIKEDLKRIIKNNKNLNKVTLSVGKFYKTIIKINEENVYSNIFVSGENNISTNLMALSIYYFSSNNKLCGVINEENEFQDIIFEKDEKEELISFLCKIPYLFINNFDKLNFNNLLTKDVLVPILSKRKEDKKSTFIFSNLSLKESINKLTFSIDVKNKLIDIFSTDYLLFNHLPTNIFDL